MSETIIDGRGSPYLAGVTDTNRLMVDAAFSAGSVAVTNSIAGSVAITSSASLNVTEVGSVRQVNVPWIVTGSVQPYNPIGVGSTLITNSLTGSVAITSSASLTGSFAITSSANLSVTEVGSVRQVNVPWIVTGSTQPYNPIGIGSVLLVNAGSVRQLTDPWIVGGSVTIATVPLDVAVNNPVIVLGSGANGTGFMRISTTNELVVVGSVRQLAVPWITTGSVTLYNTPAVTIAQGPIMQQPVGSNVMGLDTGSVMMVGGWNEIGSSQYLNLVGVQLLMTGSVRQAVTPWIFNGSVRQTNVPWIVTGSVSLYNSSADVTGSVQLYTSYRAPTYFVSAITPTSANLNHLSIFNSGAAASRVVITKINASSYTTSQTLASIKVQGTIDRFTNFPSGTVYTSGVEADTIDAAWSTVGVIAKIIGSQALSAPSQLMGWELNTDESVAGVMGDIYNWNGTRFTAPITLRGNEGIAIRQNAASGAGSIVWSVELSLPSSTA